MFGRSMQEGQLVIDLRCMNKVEIAHDGKTVLAQGGVYSGDIGQILSEKGLVTTLGACISVGYAGFAMFGGYGIVSGTYGMGCDNIVGAKLVDANGEIVDASEELLWAIRGAGGAFGVVTELKIRTYDMPTVCYIQRKPLASELT
jgi:FAD/FMN-containing dehydrogenase